MAEMDRNGATASGRCPRKVSIAKAPQQYKVKMDTGDRKGKVNQVVSLMPLGGVIELIGVWNQDGSDDGFDPFLKRSVRDFGTFATRASLFRLAERRAPPGALFEYLPSPQKQRKQNGDPFSRHWYMRLVNPDNNEDSVEVRKKIAHSICHVSWWIVRFVVVPTFAVADASFDTTRSCLTTARAFTAILLSQFLKKNEEKERREREERQRQRGGEDTGDLTGIGQARRPSKGLQNFYVVPTDHWDLTPEPRQPLDHYVTDPFVGEAISASMQISNNALEHFAVRYPVDAAYFFSGPPYSALAVKDFGYQNPSTFTPNEGESAPDNDNDNDNDNDTANKSNRNLWYFGESD